MMDEGDGGTLGWRYGPTAAQEVDLAIGIYPTAQVKRQMQVQEGGWRARPYRRALVFQRLVPSGIGAVAGAAANGGILMSDLTIQNCLSGGVIADLFISQEGYQALLQGTETPFDLTFGLWAGSDQMGYAQSGEGALKL